MPNEDEVFTALATKPSPGPLLRPVGPAGPGGIPVSPGPSPWNAFAFNVPGKLTRPVEELVESKDER